MGKLLPWDIHLTPAASPASRCYGTAMTEASTQALGTPERQQPLSPRTAMRTVWRCRATERLSSQATRSSTATTMILESSATTQMANSIRASTKSGRQLPTSVPTTSLGVWPRTVMEESLSPVTLQTKPKNNVHSHALRQMEVSTRVSMKLARSIRTSAATEMLRGKVWQRRVMGKRLLWATRQLPVFNSSRLSDIRPMELSTPVSAALVAY